MDFNYETLKGLIDRAIVALVGWAVGAGYIPADLVGSITPVLMGIPPIIFAWWFNTSSSLAHAARVAAVSTKTTTKEDIKVAEDTVKELKNTKLA